MSTATLAIIIAFASALIAPLAGYIIASRRLSGKIAYTDSSRLWDAQEEIRLDYRTQLEKANVRIISLEGSVASLIATAATSLLEKTEAASGYNQLLEDFKKLQEAFRDSGVLIAELKTEIVGLKDEIRELKKQRDAGP